MTTKNEVEPDGLVREALLWARCTTCSTKVLVRPAGSRLPKRERTAAAVILRYEAEPHPALPFCKACAEAVEHIRGQDRTVNLEVLRRAREAAAIGFGQRLQTHLAQLDIAERAARERHIERKQQHEYCLFNGDVVLFEESTGDLGALSPETMQALALYEMLILRYAWTWTETGGYVPF